MISQLTKSDLDDLLAARKNAIILFDAGWNRVGKDELQAALAKVSQEYGDRMAVAMVNVDEQVDLARAACVSNIPAVAYYYQGKHVETVVGANQDVQKRVQSLLAGKIQT